MEASELEAVRQVVMKANYKADVVQRQLGDLQKQVTGVQDRMNRMEALLQGLVNSQARASDLTTGRCAPKLRPTEEPRTLPDLTQPAELETVMTRRIEDLRQINLNSTQGVQLMGTPEGNFNSPSTGYSVVQNGWGQSQLPHAFVASPTLNNLNPNSEPDLARQWHLNPREYLNQPQFKYHARQWNPNPSNDRAHSFYKSLAKGPKLDFLEFDGGEPWEWIRQSETYFAMANVPDEAQIDLAQLYMVGRADKRLRCTGLFWKLPPWPDFCNQQSRSNYNQKFSYELLPRVTEPKKNDGTSDEATSSMLGTRSFTDLPGALVCEVLAHLDPKGLGIVSCVSTLLHTLATDHQGWKKFYCERWGFPNAPIVLNGPLVPGGAPDGKSWKTLFVEREFRCKSFMGRFSVDVLRGLSEDVCTVFLLASANLIFTGGHDSVIRMWDMEEGLLIDKSRPLGCTIRAIAADNRLLVTGGTNAFIQCWRAVEGNSYLFHISGNSINQNFECRLWGHEGPVTCLALDSMRIYSGSWDMTVRIWDRAQMKCVQKFMHADWVWSLAPHGNIVASTAGRDAYLWDIRSGELTSIISNAHVGNAYSLARTHLPDVLFTGGEDGAIRLFNVYDVSDDEDINPAATWVPHTGPVHSLAFEYPWLVSASSDGRIALIDLRKLLTPKSSSKHPFRVKSFDPSAIEPPQRMLHGFGCSLFSIDIGADRIVCGGDDGGVRVWNFSEALEIEKRAQALRSLRQENRMRRRKAQVEMNTNGRRADQCSIAVKRNLLKGNNSVTWNNKLAINDKVKS